MFYKNKAGQKIGVQMVDLDNKVFTGTVTVYITGDAGTQAIGTVGSGICTNEGNGYYTYAPAQAETDFDLIAFTFVGTNASPATIQVHTASPWDILLSDILISSSIGKLIKDNLDAAITTRAAATDLANLIAENKVVCAGPTLVEKPVSGTKTYRFDFYLNKMFGGVNTPTSISVAAVNEAGTSRTARLDSTTPTTVNTGHYRTIYTSTNTDTAPETIILTLSVVNGANTSKYGISFNVFAPTITAAQAASIFSDCQSIVLDTNGLATQVNTVESKVDIVDTVVDTILARIPTALTAGGFMKASVEAVKNTTTDADKLQDLLQNVLDATNDVLKVDLRRVDGVVLAAHKPGTVPSGWILKKSGTLVDSGTPTQVEIVDTNPTDFYKGCIIVVESGFGDTVQRTITNSTNVGILTINTSTNMSLGPGLQYYIYEQSTQIRQTYEYIRDTVKVILDDIKGTSFNTSTDSLRQISQRNIYYADINFNKDSTTDEWTVQWFKNDTLVTSGITSPTITIIKRSDGTNLVNAAAMTQVGSTGAYKYDGTSGNRLTAGDTYIVHVEATIDSATRSCRKVTGRDST